MSGNFCGCVPLHLHPGLLSSPRAPQRARGEESIADPVALYWHLVKARASITAAQWLQPAAQRLQTAAQRLQLAALWLQTAALWLQLAIRENREHRTENTASGVMVLIADTLSFQEFMNRESLPLATLHRAVFEFLRDRQDVVLFGAQAVNAYVGEPRMTQDIDVLSLQAASLAEELRSYLSERFYIAVRVRMVEGGQGYRLYQDRKKGNRHLMDIRQVEMLPDSRCIEIASYLATLRGFGDGSSRVGSK
ncbi:MAG: hypothetical protein AB4352_10790 [Hormoscilla sp.]